MPNGRLMQSRQKDCDSQRNSNMRATIKQLHNGNVVLAYDDSVGREIREFSVRNDGKLGYVMEWNEWPNGWLQVYDRLRRAEPRCTGNKLTATAESLADVIRREYRAMRRRNAKRKQ